MNTITRFYVNDMLLMEVANVDFIIPFREIPPKKYPIIKVMGTEYTIDSWEENMTIGYSIITYRLIELKKHCERTFVKRSEQCEFCGFEKRAR